MPLNASRGDGPREFILMLISTLIEEMDLVGSCDGNRRIDGDVGHRNPYDSLMVAPQVLDLGL